MKKIGFVVVASIAFLFTHAQKATPLWQDFIEAKEKGTTPVLPDFSYAGYHFSEKAIPAISGEKKCWVTDYSAIPNDDKSDEDGIQAAILSAEKNNGGVVFFHRENVC